jgi:hypothetical protein
LRFIVFTIASRVARYHEAGGNATISNWDLVYKHQVQIIGFNLGVLIRAAPQIFGEIMGERGARSLPASSRLHSRRRTHWAHATFASRAPPRTDRARGDGPDRG